MSEVEKLYENVGIKLGCCKYAEYGYEGKEGTWYYCTKEGKECWTYPNGNANCVEKDYPPFTAEKQIELIKWLSKRCFYIEISEMADKSYGIAFRYQPADEYKNEQSECCTNKNFAEALAESINYIWQDLSEEEKQQMKGILE